MFDSVSEAAYTTYQNQLRNEKKYFVDDCHSDLLHKIRRVKNELTIIEGWLIRLFGEPNIACDDDTFGEPFDFQVWFGKFQDEANKMLVTGHQVKILEFDEVEKKYGTLDRYNSFVDEYNTSMNKKREEAKTEKGSGSQKVKLELEIPEYPPPKAKLTKANTMDSAIGMSSVGSPDSDETKQPGWDT